MFDDLFHVIGNDQCQSASSFAENAKLQDTIIMPYKQYYPPPPPPNLLDISVRKLKPMVPIYSFSYFT